MGVVLVFTEAGFANFVAARLLQDQHASTECPRSEGMCEQAHHGSAIRDRIANARYGMIVVDHGIGNYEFIFGWLSLWGSPCPATVLLWALEWIPFFASRFFCFTFRLHWFNVCLVIWVLVSHSFSVVRPWNLPIRCKHCDSALRNGLKVKGHSVVIEAPHPGERYNVCTQWCRDTRTVTRVRHHLLC